MIKMSPSAREKLESYCKILDTQFFTYIFVHNRSFLDILQNCNLLRTLELYIRREQNKLFFVKLNPELTRKLLKEAKATLTM